MTFSRLRIVSALGVIQIFGWGSSFYLIAILSDPMTAEMGWSSGVIAAAVSVGLAVSGLAASSVGRLIDRFGGRPVIASGMGLIALGLCLLGSARSVPMLFAAWAVMGFGMSAGLYDAAFSTLGKIFGREARAAITQLTLWGGFASTVCWPLTGWMVETWGWRAAPFGYAGVHVMVTIPLALFVLPRAVRPKRGPGDPEVVPAMPAAVTDPRFLAIAVAGVLLSMLATILSVHLVTLLGALGYGLAAAIGIGTVLGPAQVAARVVEMAGRGRHHPVWTMLISTGFVAIGFFGLMAGLPAAAAVIAFGAGNGLWSIARGALPLAIFGSEGYARTMGRLATPLLLASAAAPSIGAWLIRSFGAEGTLTAMAVAAIVPLGMAILLLPARRMGNQPSA